MKSKACNDVKENKEDGNQKSIINGLITWTVMHQRKKTHAKTEMENEWRNKDMMFQ